MATYPNSYLRFHASNIILNIDSNTAYFVVPKVVGYFQLNTIPKPKYDKQLNGIIIALHFNMSYHQ